MIIHIGKEIERIYRESGMKLSEFSKRINTSSRNVYSICERSEIKTDQLKKISEVLGFNFFSFYQSDLEPQPLVEESEALYQRRYSYSITVSLELDGAQATLDRHIKRITAINRLVSRTK